MQIPLTQKVSSLLNKRDTKAKIKKAKVSYSNVNLDMLDLLTENFMHSDIDPFGKQKKVTREDLRRVELEA